MQSDSDVLKVYQTGPRMRVGFGGQDVPDEYCLSRYRDELYALLDEHQCESLTVDLSGVRFAPSGLLGILASVYKRGIAVCVQNPSPDVREVLRISRLDQILRIEPETAPATAPSE